MDSQEIQKIKANELCEKWLIVIAVQVFLGLLSHHLDCNFIFTVLKLERSKTCNQKTYIKTLHYKHTQADNSLSNQFLKIID